MSRKLLLSSIAIAATATLLGVGTFARFSDSGESKTATVTAGTLNLEVGGGAVSANYSFDNAYPGYTTGTDHGFVLSNTGSLPGVLHVYLQKDADAENGIVGPEADAKDIDAVGGEIDNRLNVTVDGNSFGFDGTVPWMGLADINVGQRVDITSMIWGGATPPIVIPAGGQYPGPAGTAELHFGWTISEKAGNEIQSDSLGFHLVFTLDQQV